MPTKKAKPAAKPAPKVTNSAANRAKALQELAVDKPWYSCRVVGGRLEFALYGGDVVFWPPVQED
jgi:hypothetical protein